MFIVSKNNFEENWKRALGERAHIREVKTEKGIFKMEMKNSQRRSKVSLWQISCINGPSIFLSFYVFWWCPPTPTLGLAIGLILVSETKTNLTQAETWISAVCFPILLPSQPSLLEDKTCSGIQPAQMSLSLSNMWEDPTKITKDF